MASVFTLYVVAASRRTVAGFVLDAASETGCLHHEPRERPFIGAAKASDKGLCQSSRFPLLPDGMLPCQHLDAALIHESCQFFKDE